MNLFFERAKQVGLSHIRDWLPSGRQDGNEWVALNPTRDDKRAGSFKVNLSTGQWMDNVRRSRRRCGVSLYAYLLFSAANASMRQT